MVDQDERERIAEAVAEGVERARETDPLRQAVEGSLTVVGCFVHVLVSIFLAMVMLAYCG